MTLELGTDNTWGLTKCGEIMTLLAVGREEFFLNCEFCEYTFQHLDKFIRHMCENHMLKFCHMESDRSPTLEDVEFEEPMETSIEEIDDKSGVLKGFERVEIELDSAGMDNTLHMKEEDTSSQFVSENNEVDKFGETELTVDYNSKVMIDVSSYTKRMEESDANEKQFIIEFINVYRKLPSLWNIKHKHYKNQKIRQYQYDILLKKYREKYPDAHKTDVIKRIKNLRLGYRRELKRHSANGVSTVYYFNAMDFLRNNEQQNNEQPDLYETETSFQEDKAIMKTELDMELTNNSKNSTSDPNETQSKDTVKDESPELTSEQKFIIELIELYRTLPALWDKNSIGYKDRESKAIQFNILLEKYKERYPDAVKINVKRKMSNLRSNVHREFKRSSTSNLYYFNALRFICNVEPQSQTQNSLYDFDDTQDTSMDGDSVEQTEECNKLDRDSEYMEMSKQGESDTNNGMTSEQNKKLKDKSEKQFIIEFINLYHSLPALWDFNNPCYLNRIIKNKQYEIMLTKYKEIMPNANILDVKKKIATLRSNFLREVKRLHTSKLKEPSLYYYDAISFLRNNYPDCDTQDIMADFNEMEDISMEADNIERPKLTSKNESDSECTVLTDERKFIIEFISLYRSLPALWDLNNPSYHDRKLRTKYYDVMLTKYREIMPNANILNVKKKISTLRSNFQREVRRLRTSNLEEPTLYYYDALSFLRNNYSDCDGQDDQVQKENVSKTESALEDTLVGESSAVINDTDDDSISFVDQTDVLLFTDEDTHDSIEKKFVLELIEMYRSLPTLWKNKDKHYHDREMKRKQYEILLGKYRERYPNATLKDVRNKINNLRSNYYMELKRVGTNGSSNRYYFNALSFLRTNKPSENLQKIKMLRKRKTIKFTPPKSNLNVAQCLMLADMYKGVPSLWDETDISFRFNNRRQEALGALHEEFNNRSGKNLTLCEFKNEIGRLRKICTNEKKQKLLCKQENYIYEPSCAYYDHIAFLEVSVHPFICTICDKSHQSLDQHKIHLASHDGSLPFKCQICERSFLASTNFTVHLRRHVQDYTYNCEICNKALATTTDLKSHMRFHTGEKSFVCEICGKSYRCASLLNSHMQCHDEYPQYKCDICNKAFYKKIVRQEHIKCVHRKVRDKICQICNKAFKSAKNLRQHKEIHAAEKKYVCRICGKRFAQHAGLSGHVKSHGTSLTEITSKSLSPATPNFFLNVEQFIILAEIYKEHTCLWDEKDIAYRFKNRREEAIRFVCEKFNQETGLNLTQLDLEKQVMKLRKSCSFEKNRKLIAKRKNLQYQRKFAYAEHIEFLEKDVAPFECSICKKIVLGPDAFKVHFAAHDGSLPFKCDICGHGFQLACNLAVHLRRHVHDYTFSCGVCNKPCATTSEVKIHMRSHTDEKPFVCDFCGYRTRTSSHLLTHRLRHQKRPRHKCKLCPKTFYETGSLYEHMSVHRNIRDKMCETCNKGFTSNKQLRQHQLIHNAEKKYSCKICEKRFAQYAGLSGHMKTHGSKITTNAPET